jgi:hypothetical protein
LLTPRKCAGDVNSSVPGRGNVVWIFLSAAFGCKEIVVAAATTRIIPADRWSRLIDRAAALLRIEEVANFAEMNISLAPHRERFIAVALGEFAARGRKVDVEVIRQPLHIALRQWDDGIGTTVAWALRAIVHGLSQ